MNKKEYINRAKTTILNRVRFHAPIVYDGHIDKSELFKCGVNPNLPIFKFEKHLNARILKAFRLAQLEDDFNILLPFFAVENIKEIKLKKLRNYTLYSPQTSSVLFVEMINKLNINYPSSSNYNLVFKEKFFKINEQILNPHYDDFELVQNLVIDDVLCDYREFVLNGSNYFLVLKNETGIEKNLSLELNIPLEKGYYFFKRNGRCVEIKNLLKNERGFFNFLCKNVKFSFSNVDGLENSVFCCLNVKLKIKITPNSKSFVFFNLSDSRLKLKSESQIEKFCALAKKKCFEIFGIRVKTKDAKFDQFFNINLPRSIWINWLNGCVDMQKEEKYIALKRLFIKERNKLVLFEKIGLQELGIYNGEYFKKVLIIKSDEKFLKVGKTLFHNFDRLSEVSLKSKEPICLSFGKSF